MGALSKTMGSALLIGIAAAILLDFLPYYAALALIPIIGGFIWKEEEKIEQFVHDHALPLHLHHDNKKAHKQHEQDCSDWDGGFIGNIHFFIEAAYDLGDADGLFGGKSDPYAFLTLDGKEVGRTKTVDDATDAEWNKAFGFKIDEPKKIEVHIFNENTGAADTALGTYSLDLSQLQPGKPLIITKGALTNTYQDAKSSISFSCTWTPPNWNCPGVRFPMRQGCDVTLYQGAHVGPGYMPEPIYRGPKVSEYVPTGCWEEIYRKMLHAQKFIYITGWSVNANISLIRVNPIFKEDGSHHHFNMSD